MGRHPMVNWRYHREQQQRALIHGKEFGTRFEMLMSRINFNVFEVPVRTYLVIPLAYFSFTLVTKHLFFLDKKKNLIVAMLDCSSTMQLSMNISNIILSVYNSNM
jgi:hypothetical protein